MPFIQRNAESSSPPGGLSERWDYCFEVLGGIVRGLVWERAWFRVMWCYDLNARWIRNSLYWIDFKLAASVFIDWIPGLFFSADNSCSGVYGVYGICGYLLVFVCPSPYVCVPICPLVHPHVCGFIFFCLSGLWLLVLACESAVFLYICLPACLMMCVMSGNINYRNVAGKTICSSSCMSIHLSFPASWPNCNAQLWRSHHEWTHRGSRCHTRWHGWRLLH